MCLICLDFQKSKLTMTEAWRNLQEMKDALTDEHYDDVVDLLREAAEDERMEEEPLEGEEDLAEILGSINDEEIFSTQFEFDFEDEDPWAQPLLPAE
jgi:Mg/Co/Ni transporter MgtE